MLRLLHCLIVMSLLAAAGYVYDIKYNATREAQKVQKLRNEIRAEKDRIASARAEWAKLSSPDRIQELAVRYLKMKPVEAMVVKSLIAGPSDGMTVPSGPVLVRGVAWTGEGRVTRVEVSTDDGRQWQSADLIGEDLPYAWREWEYRWVPSKPGPVTFACRATDSHGVVQPERSAWNPGGFLWNGWDRVTVTVES